MNRPLSIALLLCSALLQASCLHAEMVVVEDIANDTELYQLTVTPAASPSPAFLYRLRSRPEKLNNGNAAAFYRRVHAENRFNATLRQLNKEFGDEWYDWLDVDVPISKLPLGKVRRAARTANKVVMHGARAGADCRECDWGLALEELQGQELVSFLLPEFQSMRSLTRLVSLQTRLAIAEQRYEDAVDLLRINYRMGRDTAEVPLLVCGLVGIAQVGMTNVNTLDLIAAPDSPNLYWALCDLPDPIVSVREAVRWEMAMWIKVFPILKDAETAVRAPEEWNRLFRESQAIMPMMVSGQRSRQAEILGALAGVPAGILGYTHAKQRLVAWGYERDQVEAMAVGQVLAIYSARIYQLAADDMEKTFYVPYLDSRLLEQEAERRLEGAGAFSDHPDREILPVASDLLPAASACRKAQVRIRRGVALLKVIEALRMHAAETGSLPENLFQVTCVPLPKNPATGRPFEYSYEDGMATLRLPISDGMNIERRYEIRLAE